MRYYITRQGLLELREGTLASNQFEDRILTSFLSDNRGLSEHDIVDLIAEDRKSLDFRELLVPEIKETLRHLIYVGAVTTDRKKAGELSVTASQPEENVELNNVYPDKRGSEYSIGESIKIDPSVARQLGWYD